MFFLFFFQLEGGRLIYVSRLGAASSTVNMTITEVTLSDGSWHNVTLHSHNRGLRLLIDGRRVGDELDSAGVHDFLDPYLTTLSIGGVKKDLFHTPDFLPQGN